jgi:NTE family protein
MNTSLRSFNKLHGVCAALLCAALLPGMAWSATTPAASPAADPAKRPKICLALSGGGARGAAHIGVLKVLEQYRVPIDCIAGTSMGALVGAAYATGMQIEEMNEITGSISTELLFKETPPREELSMRRKLEDYTLLFGPEIGVLDGSLKLPKGVVTGVQLETVLRKLSKAKGFHRFDDLPIPFRAVATDLVTGKPVVFKEGELANVMRASMSVPGAIAPAEFGGMMLVDGMLTENLPVQVARSMGADIVIAVNVGTPLLRRDQLDGILGVASQMVSILTEQNVQASLALLKPTDILISPELGEYTTADFDRLAKIAPLGQAAAEKVSAQLAQLSIPAGQYAALRKRQVVAVAPEVQPINEIRFDNLKRVNPDTVLSVMETAVNQPMDQDTVDRDMRRIYGTGDFEHVNYRIIDEPGRRVLAVDAVEKTWGPDFMRFGLGLSSDFTSAAYFELAASYRKTWLNSLGAYWNTMLQFGHTNSLLSEFNQPLNAEGSYFIAPRVEFVASSFDLYQGSNNIATYRTNSALIGLDVGTQFQRYGELRLGLVGGKRSGELETGPTELALETGRITESGVRASLVLDRLNSTHFPRSGWRSTIDIYNSNTALGSDDSFTKWSADGTAVYSFGEHTFNLSAKAGGKLGSDPLPRYNQFQWGGFLAQSGYKTGQLYGENLAYGRLMYYHRIWRGSLLEGAYGGMSLELGKVGDPLVSGSPDGLLKSGSLFIGSDSPVGPAYLGYGRAVDGNQSFYFFLGRAF